MRKWNTIDSAPKDGTEVIVGCSIADVWITRGAFYIELDETMIEVQGYGEDDEGWWSYKNSVTQEKLDGIYSPTHWLPFPPDTE